MPTNTACLVSAVVVLGNFCSGLHRVLQLVFVREGSHRPKQFQRRNSGVRQRTSYYDVANPDHDRD